MLHLPEASTVVKEITQGMLSRYLCAPWANLSDWQYPPGLLRVLRDCWGLHGEVLPVLLRFLGSWEWHQAVAVYCEEPCSAAENLSSSPLAQSKEKQCSDCTVQCSSTSRPGSHCWGRNSPMYVCGLGVNCCSLPSRFASCSLLLAQAMVSGFVILSLGVGRASGRRALWRLRAVSFSVCWKLAVGKGSRCLLVLTVLAAGFDSGSTACFSGSDPAFSLSVSVVFVFLPLLGLAHKQWVLHAGQAGHPCRCVGGKYSKPRRGNSDSDTQLRALHLKSLGTGTSKCGCLGH